MLFAFVVFGFEAVDLRFDFAPLERLFELAFVVFAGVGFDFDVVAFFGAGFDFAVLAFEPVFDLVLVAFDPFEPVFDVLLVFEPVELAFDLEPVAFEPFVLLLL